MKKKEAMKYWGNLEPNQDPLEHMNPIPYKASGSTFGACGIRICGNPEFVDAVLSNLKSLLDGENNNTRLNLMYNDVKPTEIKGQKKSYDNAAKDAKVVYIQLHERGRDAQAMNNIFNVHQSGK